MMLVRCFSGIITWIFIILFVCLMFGATAIFAIKYFNLSVSIANLSTINLSNLKQAVSVTQSTQNNTTNLNYYLAGFIIFSILSLVTLAVLCCICGKIKLSIAIMKTSAIFIQDNPSAIFLPFFNVLAVLLYFIYFVVAFVLLYSTGTKTVQANN